MESRFRTVFSGIATGKTEFTTGIAIVKKSFRSAFLLVCHTYHRYISYLSLIKNNNKGRGVERQTGYRVGISRKCYGSYGSYGKFGNQPQKTKI
jgi:hypothetical protein